VVILSDGWDRGEPEVLAAEMARLRRSAHRVIWLNPLKAAPGYAPLARGMAAALPHADHFLAGHSLRSLGSWPTCSRAASRTSGAAVTPLQVRPGPPTVAPARTARVPARTALSIAARIAAAARIHQEPR
jgi:hypothetical protein